MYGFFNEIEKEKRKTALNSGQYQLESEKCLILI